MINIEPNDFPYKEAPGSNQARKINVEGGAIFSKIQLYVKTAIRPELTCSAERVDAT